MVNKGVIKRACGEHESKSKAGMVNQHVDASSSGKQKELMNEWGGLKEGAMCRRRKRVRRISSKPDGYIILAEKQNIKVGHEKEKGRLELDG